MGSSFAATILPSRAVRSGRIAMATTRLSIAYQEGGLAMERRRARFRNIRYTPSPELLEDRRLLAEILQPHRHARPPNPPAGQIAPGFRGEIRAEAAAWQAGAPIPLARTEVAAAVVAGEVVVIGGLLWDGSSSS